MPYILQHIGYPVASRPIRPKEWGELSQHETENDAWNAMEQHTKHLNYGQWDDQYRVVAPDGHICDYEEFKIRRMLTSRVAASMLGSIRTPRKATAARENGKKGGRPRKK